QHWSHGWLPG
uniref:Gonadoliberin n=1 Tax=Squalus acanthias TaxID=7797 RepID=GONL_SQUAC|nr:RecName: Full=Gonadoliberin; AltName: Full=Gonadotropin-releasing hormone; Short=GnRH; AltName: Full=LH-RH; AltName: Full=Luliberin [Squalus acanthias]